MIVKMSKVFIAASTGKSEDFLIALRKLGVMHIVPVDKEKAAPDNATAARLANLKTAVDELKFIKPAGEKPQLTPQQAADSVCTILRREQELHNRLSVVRRNIYQIEAWGNVTVESIKQLVANGLELVLLSINADDLDELRQSAQCVTVLREHKKNELIVAAVYRTVDEIVLPHSATEIERPKIDAPTLHAQADEIKFQMNEDAAMLSSIAVMSDEIHNEYLREDAKAKFISAHNSALAGNEVFAMQGWVTSTEAPSLAAKLQELGITAAVSVMQPDDGETPPTLIRYHRWVKPIIALFDILGTVPGYKEYDIAPFFMLTMPIFTAMLVGDACYGLIFTLIGLIFGKKLHKLTGKKSAGQLITVFGVFTLVWGIMSACYFGVTPGDIAKAGNYGTIVKEEFQPDYDMMRNSQGAWATIGKVMLAPAFLWRADDVEARNIVMKISFILAVIHLMLAHIRKMARYFPSQPFLAEVGWSVFLFGMFEVVWLMFFNVLPLGDTNMLKLLLIGGASLIVLFTVPSPNPLRRVGIGALSNIMPIINTFGDTLSYIRLMAVGLSGYYMASAFNGLAVKIFDAGWYWIWASAIVLIVAHSLNIFLCVIAVFAHGVRLNLLEFSGNCGVEWTGYPFTPFYDTLKKQGE